MTRKEKMIVEAAPGASSGDVAVRVRVSQSVQRVARRER